MREQPPWDVWWDLLRQSRPRAAEQIEAARGMWERGVCVADAEPRFPRGGRKHPVGLFREPTGTPVAPWEEWWLAVRSAKHRAPEAKARKMWQAGWIPHDAIERLPNQRLPKPLGRPSARQLRLKAISRSVVERRIRGAIEAECRRILHHRLDSETLAWVRAVLERANGA